jgi:hypothetical protein
LTSLTSIITPHHERKLVLRFDPTQRNIEEFREGVEKGCKACTKKIQGFQAKKKHKNLPKKNCELPILPKNLLR